MGTKKMSWQAASGYQGVRFREHETRTWNRKPDRYFAIRYRVSIDGKSKQVEEGVGWASEGYTAQRAAALRSQILQTIDDLGRPFSLSELRSGHAQQSTIDRLIARQRLVTVNHAGEAFLEWKFVDLERNTLRLRGKGGKFRTVFADAECLRMLQRRYAEFGHQTHVFWKISKPISVSRLGTFFRTLVEKLGWNSGFEQRQDHIVFHSLRHTYGTRAIMRGMNPLTLKTLMGHNSLTTTDRYVHLAEEFMRGQVTG